MKNLHTFHQADFEVLPLLYLNTEKFLIQLASLQLPTPLYLAKIELLIFDKLLLKVMHTLDGFVMSLQPTFINSSF